MGHTFTNHLYHIVFSTKNRKPVITSKMKDELYKYMCGIARNHRGKILRINGVEDHVHLLAKIQPSIIHFRFCSIDKGKFLQMGFGKVFCAWSIRVAGWVFIFHGERIKF